MSVQISRDSIKRLVGINTQYAMPRKVWNGDGETVVWHYAKIKASAEVQLSDGKTVVYALHEADDADIVWVGPQLDTKPTYRDCYQALGAAQAPSLNNIHRQVMQRLHDKVGEDLSS